MVAQEGAPALSGRATSLDHILGNGRLSDGKTELEQLTMNALGIPKRILNAHSSDQRPQIRVDLRPAAQGAGFPAPIVAKAGSMPAHDGLGPDDRYGLENRWKPAIQLNEEEAIGVREVNTTAHFALKHDQLTSERGILCFKPALRLEARGNHIQQEAHQRDHSC